MIVLPTKDQSEPVHESMKAQQSIPVNRWRHKPINLIHVLSGILFGQICVRSSVCARIKERCSDLNSGRRPPVQRMIRTTQVEKSEATVTPQLRVNSTGKSNTVYEKKLKAMDTPRGRTEQNGHLRGEKIDGVEKRVKSNADFGGASTSKIRRSKWRGALREGGWAEASRPLRQFPYLHWCPNLGKCDEHHCAGLSLNSLATLPIALDVQMQEQVVKQAVDHSDQCRSRMEAILITTTEGHQRLERARHRFAQAAKEPRVEEPQRKRQRLEGEGEEGGSL